MQTNMVVRDLFVVELGRQSVNWRGSAVVADNCFVTATYRTSKHG